MLLKYRIKKNHLVKCSAIVVSHSGYASESIPTFLKFFFTKSWMNCTLNINSFDIEDYDFSIHPKWSETSYT